MPKKVLFYMKAYNSEKYIRQALDSLLKQTDPNWAIWIDDNGSTDSTGRICDEYAAKDERFFCYHYKINNQPAEEEIKAAYEIIVKKGIYTREFAEYVSVLDSDDYLDPLFVEKMYAEGKNHNADIVVGGSIMFDENNPGNSVKRIPPGIVIENGRIYENDFINLYGSLRALWGKLYSMDIWNKKDIEAPYTGEINSGFDTYQVLTIFSNCARTVVSVPSTLYYYRIRKDSDYNRRSDARRYEEGKLLYEIALKKTAVKFRIDTPKIREFLLTVYFFHIKDLFEVAVNSYIMTPKEKVEFITQALKEELFRKCADSFPNDTNTLLKISVENALKGLDRLERAKLYDNYVVRLLEGPKSTGKKDKEVWLFSVLCDPENKLRWGSDVSSGIDWTKRNIVLQAVNQPQGGEHISAKQELLSAIDDGKLETALEKLAFLKGSMPLDRETLYFEMYLSLIMGDKVKAVETAAIAKVFWGEDEDINEMISMVNENT